jgi:flagellar basal-body rod protein FlgB
MRVFDRTIFLLGKVLDLRSVRHQVLATNIANADTPGYKGVDLFFEEELQKAVKSPREIGLANTHAMHFPRALSLGSVRGRIESTETISMRNDDNSVNMEQEMVKLAENSLLYEAAIHMLTKKLRGLREAIQEGR